VQHTILDSKFIMCEAQCSEEETVVRDSGSCAIPSQIPPQWHGHGYVAVKDWPLESARATLRWRLDRLCRKTVELAVLGKKQQTLAECRARLLFCCATSWCPNDQVVDLNNL